jgi:uncharacterized repeat protein (TIGR02543 family)
VCSSRGERWELTRCDSEEICAVEAPGCVAGRTLTVSSVGGLVLSTPTGISCNPSCAATFPDGAAVTLTAQPFPDAEFLGWSGACAGRGMDPTCPLTMDADLSAGAEFSQSTYPVRLDFRGDGDGEVRFEGRRDEAVVVDTCRDDCTLRFDRETMVTLTASPDAGVEFAGWGQDCSGGGACTLTLSDPGGADVRARFELPRQTLTVSRDGAGAGTVTSSPEGIDCGSDCDEDFIEGTAVTLSAVPQGGSEFVGWSGDCSGMDPTCEVTMDAARNVTASFDGQSFALTVATDGDGVGTVTSVPSGIDCGADCSEAFGVGQVVTLTATAAPGHRFAGWSGDCAGTGVDCEVTMDQDRAATATFEEIRLQVTVNVTGGGRVVSDPAAIDCPGTCAAEFASGASIDLVATPDAGRAIESWSGVCAGSGRADTCTFSVTQAESVNVAFTDFFLVPLAADMSCRTLLRFGSSARLQDACGGGSAVETGAWSVEPSRTAALADAYAPSVDGDALDLGEALAAPPRATVELTVRRTGSAFGGGGYGVLASDRESTSDGPGFELLAHDDGRVELRTWTSSTAFSTVETSSGTLPLSAWRHVAAVVDSSRLEIFVDGSSAAVTTSPVEWTASSSTAVLGATRDGSGFTRTLRGEVDEVRSSDVARY